MAPRHTRTPRQAAPLGDLVSAAKLLRSSDACWRVCHKLATAPSNSCPLLLALPQVCNMLTMRQLHQRFHDATGVTFASLYPGRHRACSCACGLPVLVARVGSPDFRMKVELPPRLPLLPRTLLLQAALRRRACSATTSACSARCSRPSRSSSPRAMSARLRLAAAWRRCGQGSSLCAVAPGG